jgi:hypothetical protein
MRIRLWFALTVCAALIPGIATAATPVKKAVRTGSLAVADDPALPIPVVPVEVENFPAVQSVAGTVSVDNLPAVQSVAGTVSVDNLPAVQNVAGSVSVSNLPLDGDGAVRVSTIPARQRVLIDLLPSPVDIGPSAVYVSPTIAMSGYSKFGYVITAIPASSIDSVVPQWRWGDSDYFHPVANGANPAPPDCSYSPWGYSQWKICAVSGEEMQLLITPHGTDMHIESVKVYLIP